MPLRPLRIARPVALIVKVEAARATMLFGGTKRSRAAGRRRLDDLTRGYKRRGWAIPRDMDRERMEKEIEALGALARARTITAERRAHLFEIAAAYEARYPVQIGLVGERANG